MTDGEILQSPLALPGSNRRWLTLRQRTLLAIFVAAGLIASAFVGASALGVEGLRTRFGAQNLAPSWEHLFGTDWLGRDMFSRTLFGLRTSVQVGLLAASSSAVVAVTLGTMAATARGAVDAVISWLVDLFMGIPHLVALILIAFAMGGGTRGVVVAVAVTHWPSLTRVVRAEVLQLREAEFIEASRGFGRSNLWIAAHHMLPHVLPQFAIGLILLIPHAILHEAGLTFLGFGLSPHEPAIGVILAESMRQLSTGRWWLALLPGLALVVMVRAFDVVGDNVRSLLAPRSVHE